MWKPDWDNFRNEIQEKINEIKLDQYMDKNQLEGKLNQWYTITEYGLNNNIPKKSKHTTHKPTTSPTLRHLQHRFQQLHLQAQITGWTIPLYHTYKTIQTKIKEESQKTRPKLIKSLDT